MKTDIFKIGAVYKLRIEEDDPVDEFDIHCCMDVTKEELKSIAVSIKSFLEGEEPLVIGGVTCWAGENLEAGDTCSINLKTGKMVKA